MTCSGQEYQIDLTWDGKPINHTPAQVRFLYRAIILTTFVSVDLLEARPRRRGGCDGEGALLG